MGFIDSYKRLEKLCSEIYNDNHGVSSYIDEMVNTSIGARYVPGWDEDLKQLKHYRRVRNQIVHDPGCTEENMCEYGDAQWLDSFVLGSCLRMTRLHSIARRVIPNRHKDLGKPTHPSREPIHTRNVQMHHKGPQAA